jgi:hypothetical protein
MLIYVAKTLIVGALQALFIIWATDHALFEQLKNERMKL